MAVTPDARARLAELTPERIDNTWRWLQDGDLRRSVDCSSAPEIEANRAYWRACLADRRREDYAILSESGVHVGNCGLKDIDTIRRKAEIWAYLGRDRSGGLGSTAVRELLRRAFAELGLNRIYLRVLATNLDGRRFWERLGFTAEGRAEQDTIVDGQFVDSISMAQLARNFRV